MLKYFRKYFRFRGDIHEIRFFFVTISGAQYPEINWFPGNNRRKFSKKTTFVNIPLKLGKNQQIYSEIFWHISGYCAPEVKFREKNSNFLFLNSYKSFKTEYIYKNQLWTICTYKGLWFEGKIMGSSKDHFLDFRVSLPGSKKYIREYLRENEIFFKNILG